MMFNKQECDALIQVLIADQKMDDVQKYGIVGRLMFLSTQDNEDL